jgi:NADH:ubiquinone oxidoreductase subunit E
MREYPEHLTITLDKSIVDYIAECLQKEHPESYLIAVLHKVQGMYGFLSNDHMYEVAHLLGVPTSTVYGVATFYHFFRLKPQGKFAISVCMGTACFVKGADLVLQAFKNELGIDIGETSSDGLFSIDGTRCLGVCALAPVVTINEQVFGNVQPSQVSEILMKIQQHNKQDI